MATIKDVAHTAGVSVASVSRVFSNHESVSPQMREKVLAAAEEHSFRPNAMGRALRRTGTRTIGLVVSDLLNPFYPTACAVEAPVRLVTDDRRQCRESLSNRPYVQTCSSVKLTA